ncbi:hypothetical protein [Amycolatopsis albispora]|uniref:Uncharacterized protein n=1 Tax=Amycolatopsis albispora TaxID=1804986 RepID=A0A344LJV8_9PSEU|nr:hypothetical protein [Amycolatopsis albispora]AXB48332.1 hypothetical protein A4R43_07200 [Amycolatopsis albispora]
MRNWVLRSRRSGTSLAVLWTLISLGVALMLWVSGIRAWPVYLLVAPSTVVSVLLWIGVVRRRRAGNGRLQRE